MNLEEALLIADEAVFIKTDNYLTDIQKRILQECWDKKTYEQIAIANGYSPQYIKNEGNGLWKLLKDALGEKVSKSNFRAGLERYQRYSYKSEESSVPRTKSVNPTQNSEKEMNVLVQEVRNKVKPYYERRYGIFKVLGMSEPVKLESVYTAVQFLDNDDIHNFESIESLEQLYRQANARRFQFQNKDKQEGIKVANEKQYLMVLGSAGVGKSTFLRKMGLEALEDIEGMFKHTCIPVFIELKTFTFSNIDIKQIIAGELHACGFLADEFIDKVLEEGKLLVLLDGLDEVPIENLNEVINKIQKFVNTYDKNRFIASCRTAAYRSKFQCFCDVTIADFDDIQIQQFIYNWFCSEADKQAQTGKKCWELLKKPENFAAKELACTPLLLTFLCLVYSRSQNFPDNRSVLYKKALRILLEEWASEKRILQAQIYQGLHTELEEILLSEIAYTNFESNRLFFSKRDVVQQIKAFLASNLNAPQHLDGERVLDAITVQQGILIERAEDIFSFSHLTIQEYLTAQYIDDHRQVEKLVTENLPDYRWQEVFLLVAGLMRGGTDNLLQLMEKEAQKYVNTPNLRTLLNWAEQVTTESAGDFKPVAKRAVAISYAYVNAGVIIYSPHFENPKEDANAISNNNAYFQINAITNAYIDVNIINVFLYSYSYARAYTHAYLLTKAHDEAHLDAKHVEDFLEAHAEIINYIRQIDKSKVFNNKVNFTLLINELEELRDEIFDTRRGQELHHISLPCLLEKTLLKAFNLDTSIIDLSEEEARALRDYLYVNGLIIQCKRASVRVSPTTWEGIEGRMLLVSGN